VTTSSFSPYRFASWSDLLARMQEERTNLAPTTALNNRRRLGEFCAWLDDKGVRPDDLTSKQQAAVVRKFINGPKAHTKPRTRQGFVLVIHRFFVFASGGITGLPDYEVLPEAPAWKVTDKELVKVPKDDAYYITRDQFETLIDKAVQDGDRRLLAMHLVMGTAGLRREELCNLTWGDVSFDDQRFAAKFHVVRGKGDKDRTTVSLDPRCRQALAEWKLACGPLARDQDAVFLGHHNGKGWSALQPASLGAIYIRLSDEVDFRVTAHALRHRCARTWHEDGMSVMAISKLLGHADLKTTQRYVSVSENDALDQASRLHDTKTAAPFPALPARRKKVIRPVGQLAA